jgi:hypothetical protein
MKRDLKDLCITKKLTLDRREWKLVIHVLVFGSFFLLHFLSSFFPAFSFFFDLAFYCFSPFFDLVFIALCFLASFLLLFCP